VRLAPLRTGRQARHQRTSRSVALAAARAAARATARAAARAAARATARAAARATALAATLVATLAATLGLAAATLYLRCPRSLLRPYQRAATYPADRDCGFIRSTVGTKGKRRGCCET
jgi:hypothetical protein